MNIILILKGLGFLLLFLFISWVTSWLIVEVWLKKYEENHFWKEFTEDE